MGKFLDYFNKRFEVYALSDGAGGCDTCGYGAEEVISQSDYEDMLKEMDAWVKENFGNAKL